MPLGPKNLPSVLQQGNGDRSGVAVSMKRSQVTFEHDLECLVIVSKFMGEARCVSFSRYYVDADLSDDELRHLNVHPIDLRSLQRKIPLRFPRRRPSRSFLPTCRTTASYHRCGPAGSSRSPTSTRLCRATASAGNDTGSPGSRDRTRGAVLRLRL